MFNPTINKSRFVFSLMVLLFAALLNGCGPTSDPSTETKNQSKESSSTIDRELSGTVATGAPVAGTITIMDADGNTLTVDSDASGAYSVNLQGRPGPYLIRVVPSDSSLPVMYSYATGSGIANITPFTSLALILAYNTDLAQAFTDWAATVSSWKVADLEQALAKLNANFDADLASAGVDPKSYDFFTTPFDANHTGIDAFLDTYKVSINFNDNSYTIKDQFDQSVTFNETIDTTNYYVGALFVPVDGTQWQLTYTQNFDGQETTATIPFLSNDIPWSRERFYEIFWTQLASTTSQTFTCDGSQGVVCDITIKVSRLDANYDVTGNGEVGTVITASGAYNWSITGYFQSPTQRQDINESHTWSYTWKWTRTQ